MKGKGSHMEGGQLSLLEKDCVVLEDDILSSVLVLKCPMSYELMVIVSSSYFFYILPLLRRAKREQPHVGFHPFNLYLKPQSLVWSNFSSNVAIPYSILGGTPPC